MAHPLCRLTLGQTLPLVYAPQASVFPPRYGPERPLAPRNRTTVVSLEMSTGVSHRRTAPGRERMATNSLSQTLLSVKKTPRSPKARWTCLPISRARKSVMCNRYTPPALLDIEREWAVGRPNPMRWWDEVLFPRGTGPFIRRARESADYERELVAGQWGLIPWFAKEPKLKYPTNNARSEELADKASYKHPWARGQRCIIPASDFDEPNWETGRNVWWRFKRADGAPWSLAGLWNVWTDKATGETHESYTMILGGSHVT